ncbi:MULTISPECIES: S1 family peptidase [unclassified Agarivorans]|uniref:S1 family peptidase n=1 Tax=unclassified Agarivorans TaxID=2636026 RepID=UPI0026E1426F|nr:MULTISPECIES: trypsin-like serine protease [unclassified Agarivorans]MDO6683941.1 trypsin-like serine protease [Agarivorans sp. 3_MG-2023]MDO6714326.1 trypsin-like serine protease [Agarivorans sp. 2_MG-2023]
MRTRILVGALLCLSGTSANAVVGGETEADEKWPELVSLRYVTPSGKIENHSCGGAYLGQGLIVSAAHCVALAPAGKSYACLGGSGEAAENNCYALEKSVKHPDYADGYDKDIAIYQMSDYPSDYPSVKLISYAENRQIKPDDILHILGLGSTAYENYQPSFQLQGALTPIVDIDTCNQKIQVDAPHQIADEDFICAGKRTLGPAPGDSGTPAFIYVNGQAKYAGLVSHGYNYMGIFTRIGRYLDWIEATKLALLGPVGVVQEKLWKVDGEVEFHRLNIELSNQSGDNLSIERFSIDDEPFSIDDEPFSIVDSSTCLSLEAGQSCIVELEVQLNQAVAESYLNFEALGFNYSIELSVIGMSPSDVLANTLAPFNQWSVGGNAGHFSRFGDAGVLISNDNQTIRQLISGEVEGPGWLSFALQYDGFSGQGRLKVMVDNIHQYQFSGKCSAESIVLVVPAGTHQIDFDYQSKEGGIVEASNKNAITASPAEPNLHLALTDLTLSEEKSSQAEIECSFSSNLHYQSLDPNESDTNGSSSGGGSFGFASISLLMLVFVRRKLIH